MSRQSRLIGYYALAVALGGNQIPGDVGLILVVVTAVAAVVYAIRVVARPTSAEHITFVAIGLLASVLTKLITGRPPF